MPTLSIARLVYGYEVGKETYDIIREINEEEDCSVIASKDEIILLKKSGSITFKREEYEKLKKEHEGIFSIKTFEHTGQTKKPLENAYTYIFGQ